MSIFDDPNYIEIDGDSEGPISIFTRNVARTYKLLGWRLTVGVQLTDDPFSNDEVRGDVLVLHLIPEPTLEGEMQGSDPAVTEDGMWLH